MKLVDRNLQQKSGKRARNFNEKEERTPKGVRESLVLERVRGERKRERGVFNAAAREKAPMGRPTGDDG
ncbi:unnamed protein product [Sphagnum jensenii]|uniref:Uncharacterized protein n=1 Tax=Sphagnum jensenii TaxID=128206 RepID=A0ABP1BAE2_9BRYO